ncbi:hypothetical protein ACFQ0M_05085 [Kitasatospora aburaviensis]
MTTHDVPPSRDQTYLLDRAASAGWSTSWEDDQTGKKQLNLALHDWAVTALFSPDGDFLYGRASGPGSTALELDLATTADVLEEYGHQNPAPTADSLDPTLRPSVAARGPLPTPPAEASTTAEISTPDPW